MPSSKPGTKRQRIRPWEDNWRSWYQLEVWRKKRRRQLQSFPLCAICLKSGIVTPATIADHILEHKGNWNEFLNGKLQSLCSNCHESGKDFLTKHGRPRPIYGADGYPIQTLNIEARGGDGGDGRQNSFDNLETMSSFSME